MGANILGTNVHLWPFVVEARRNRARLYTIDPRRNRTEAASDKHFFINPGSDTALAFAMMHVIIGENLHDAEYVDQHTEGFDGLRERVREWTPQRAAELTGIAAEEIVQLAREYATTRPAVIRLNYGVQRSERGAMAVRTIALLPALVGSWKDLGGGIQLSTYQAFHLNYDGLARAAVDRETAMLHVSSADAARRGIAVAVELNQKIAKGHRLLVMEAMTMQSTVYAPVGGTVKQMLVQPGQHVEARTRCWSSSSLRARARKR